MQITIEIDDVELRDALSKVLGAGPNKPVLAEVLPIKPDEIDELLADDSATPTDKAGVPFDENLHSGIDKFNNDGTWRKKRVAKPKSQYKAEKKASKELTFVDLMNEFSNSKLEQADFDAAVKACGITKQLYLCTSEELNQIREKLFN